MSGLFRKPARAGEEVVAQLQQARHSRSGAGRAVMERLGGGTGTRARGSTRRIQLENLESRVLLTGAPVGINLEAVNDWSRSFMFVDAMKSARQFGSVNTPWDEAAPVDANGWPTGDAGACIITVGDNTVPGQAVASIDGTYKFSATGNVTITPVLTA